MARLLLTVHSSMGAPQAGMAVLTVLFCAFALVMCASHSRRWRRWTACTRSWDDDPVIQQVDSEGVMTFSPTQGGHSQQLSGPVWQKNILMGGKCRLPDFSGVIVYDATGNVVTPSKPPRLALPWK